ncbi:hypothetical protein Gpo141_00004465 [Globisporangium polare]
MAPIQQQQQPRAKKPSSDASATAAGKKKAPTATVKKKSDGATATVAAGTSVKGKRKRSLGKQPQRDEDEDDDDAFDEDGGFEDEDGYDDDDDDEARSNSQLSTEADGESKSADTGPGEEKAKPRRGRRRMLHDEEQRKQRRKNQCKLNQRRYRARQRGMISTLSLETDTLTDFIHELEAYQQFLFKYKQNEAALSTQQISSGRRQRDLRPLLVVDQFFHFFKHGFALHSIEISDIQERFVRFISAPNLISQGATKAGVDALLLQLKRYTSYHAIFELHLDSRRVVYSPDQQQVQNSSSRAGDSEEEKASSAVSSSSMWVVQVSGRMHLRLSRDTVMLVYPHIVKDEALSYRVVGHEIDPPFSVVFQFNELGKLCKLELMVDFAGAFMQLLNSAEQVAILLGRALISPHCELGIDPHEESAIGPGSGENKQLSLKFILL